MMQLSLGVPSQIEGMESVSLIAETVQPFVDFPRFVSVPKCPLTIGYSEFFLKTFTQSPFG